MSRQIYSHQARQFTGTAAAWCDFFNSRESRQSLGYNGHETVNPETQKTADTYNDGRQDERANPYALKSTSNKRDGSPVRPLSGLERFTRKYGKNWRER